MKYFSANGEDFLLSSFFGHKRNGVYLDIGAFDGIHFSNTYSFELQGWQGVCVEPQPAFFTRLLRNRPSAICLNAACVSDPTREHATLYCEELGLLSATQKTPDYEDFVAGRYLKRGLAFSGFTEVTVPAVTIDEVIARVLPARVVIDFVSIDVEGTEMDVLKGFDVQRHRPEVIVIEANCVERAEEIKSFLQAVHHYNYAGTLVENIFFVREKSEVDKLRNIRIDCTIEPQLHPLGERFTPELYKEGRKILQKKRNGLKW